MNAGQFKGSLFFLVLFFISQPVMSDTPYKFEEGKDYFLLPPELQSNSNKVIEFFSYSCPFCYRAERGVNIFLQNKKKDIMFERIPVYLGKKAKFETSAYAYLIAEKLGLLDRFHDHLFDLNHVSYGYEKEVYNELANLSDVKKLFMDNGISEKDFDNAYEFFKKNETIKSNDKLASNYKVEGTPTFIIRGKYRVNGYPNGVDGQKQLGYLLLYLSQK